MYVLDAENNRVEVFDGEGHFLTKWGQRGVGYGYFSQPGALALGCDGSVYVADTNNNRIERFVLSTANDSGCLAPGSWPPPLDVAPVLKVQLPRAGGILARRALALSVSCQRGCKVLVSATLAPVAAVQSTRVIRVRPSPLAPRLTEAERAAHRALVAAIGPKAIWNEFFRDVAVAASG